jgi:hypothetical protein
MNFPNIFKDKKPSHLCQGDIFKKINTEDVLPPSSAYQVGYMILNNTCDLIHLKDLAYLSICPIFKISIIIEEYIKANAKREKKNIIESLSNKLYSLSNNKKKIYFFIPTISSLGDTPNIADISQIIKISTKYKLEILENRIKVIKSPWREKLAWKIANLFNRVALPDINREVIDKTILKSEILDKFLKKYCEKVG